VALHLLAMRDHAIGGPAQRLFQGESRALPYPFASQASSGRRLGGEPEGRDRLRFAALVLVAMAGFVAGLLYGQLGRTRAAREWTGRAPGWRTRARWGPEAGVLPLARPGTRWVLGGLRSGGAPISYRSAIYRGAGGRVDEFLIENAVNLTETNRRLARHLHELFTRFLRYKHD